MACKARVAGTKAVFFNLLLCLMVFYTLYYMIGSVCFGAFRLELFDGLFPFDFKTQVSMSSPKYLVILLSMELTYFISGLVFAAIVKKWIWDYSVTVTLSHVVLSCALVGMTMMICNGQLVAYFICQKNHSYLSDI
ncbi:transmembrane protein 244 isoform X3 [Leucoraja erinacea]|uniref:transmembrane protein 244 isoform X3 n=1 Tax=Leucoraja erinaceus TaxID=7782 RepID=UPI0024566A59|nr:transmembrane protein 244 isoform X3 [Leucoraja erinacea]